MTLSHLLRRTAAAVAVAAALAPSLSAQGRGGSGAADSIKYKYATTPQLDKYKDEIAREVDAKAKMIQEMVDQVFSFGELGMQEFETSKRILFAWNGSTESARAISLAMPVLAGAESIDVLSVDGAMVPGPTSAEIAESLRSHGLNVTSQHVKPGSRTAGQTIVDTAIAGGADLIVKGAYTQSRLRQMIFGGMTRHLILNSPLPVLFSY